MNKKVKKTLFFSILVFTMIIGLGFGTEQIFAKATYLKEIVFIDQSVKDFQVLESQIKTEAEVVYLQTDSDGIKQISDFLAKRTNTDVVHVISHGDPGRIYLGSTILSLDNMEDYAEELSIINQAINKKGKLLLYGCNIGQDVEGESFVKQLAEKTDTLVAASDNATGSYGLGGDWSLEMTSKPIENLETLIFENYKWLLATTYTFDGPVTPDAPTAATLEEAIEVSDFISGATLKLYLTDGTLVATETNVTTATYTFNNVEPNSLSYYVTQTVLGQESTNSSFVNATLRTPTASAGIEYVEASNRYTGATMTLYAEDGTLISSTPTDQGGGIYRFTGLTPENVYYVMQSINGVQSLASNTVTVQANVPDAPTAATLEEAIEVSDFTSGATLKLYLTDGTLVATETNVTTATYTFNNVEPNSLSYYVTQTVSGQESTNSSFVNTTLRTPTASAGIEYVEASNRYTGATMTLYAEDGTLISSTPTDQGGGIYRFTGLTPENVYYVMQSINGVQSLASNTVTVQANVPDAPTAATLEEAIEVSDFTSGATLKLYLTDGTLVATETNVTTATYTFNNVEPNSLSYYVTQTVSGQESTNSSFVNTTLRTPTASAGIEYVEASNRYTGATMTLYAEDGTLISSTPTDQGGGIYRFTGLTPENVYYVMQSINGVQSLASNTVTVQANVPDAPTAATLEEAIEVSDFTSGATLKLYLTDGTLVATETNVTTATYTFNNVEPNSLSYYVTQTVSGQESTNSGFVNTTLRTPTASAGIEYVEASNRYTGATMTLYAEDGTLISSTPTDQGGGIYRFTGLTPENVYYVMQSINGVQSLASNTVTVQANVPDAPTAATLEEAIEVSDFTSGATLKLYLTDGTLVATETNVTTATYTFNNVEPNSLSYYVTQTVSGQESTNSSFVNTTLRTPTASAGIEYVEASNRYTGATMTLYAEDGTLISSTPTDQGGGIYRFTGLTPENVYYVMQSINGVQSLASNTVTVQANVPDAPTAATLEEAIEVSDFTSGATLKLYLTDGTLVATETNVTTATYTFNNVEPNSLSYYVTQTVSGQESTNSSFVNTTLRTPTASAGIEYVEASNRYTGATMTLYAEDGTLISSTPTDQGGGIYRFTGLTPGNVYYVVQSINGVQSLASNTVTVQANVPDAPTAATLEEAIEVSDFTSGATLKLYLTDGTLVATETNVTTATYTFNNVEPNSLSYYVTQTVSGQESTNSSFVNTTLRTPTASAGIEYVEASNRYTGATMTLYAEDGTLISSTPTDQGGGIYRFTGLTPENVYYVMQSINGVQSLASNTVTVQANVPDAPTAATLEEAIEVSDFTSGATLKLYLTDGTLVATETNVTTATYTFNNVEPNSLSYYVTQTVSGQESTNSSFVNTTLRTPTASAGIEYVEASNRYTGATMTLYAEDGTLISSTPTDQGGGIYRFTGLTPENVYYVMQSINGVQSLASNTVTVQANVPDAPTAATLEEAIEVSDFTSGATLKLYLTDGTLVATETNVTTATYTFNNVEPNSLSYYVTQTVSGQESTNSSFVNTTLRTPTASAGIEYVEASNRYTGATMTLYAEDGTLISSTPTDQGGGIYRFTGLTPENVYYVMQSINGVQSLASNTVTVQANVPDAPTAATLEEAIEVSDFTSGATLKLYLTDGTLVATETNVTTATYTFNNVEPNSLSYYVTQTVSGQESTNSSFVNTTLRTPTASAGIEYVEASNRYTGATMTLYAEDGTLISSTPTDQGGGIYRFTGLTPENVYYVMQSINGVQSLASNTVTVQANVPDAPTAATLEEAIEVSDFTSGATLKLYLTDGTLVATETNVTTATYTFNNVEPNSLSYYVTQTVSGQESTNSSFVNTTLRTPTASAGIEYVEASNRYTGATMTLYAEDGTLISSTPTDQGGGIYRFTGLTPENVYYVMQSINGVQSLASNTVTVQANISDAPNVTADDTNNTIIDADGTMEYSADNGTSWSDYDSSNEPSFAGNQTVLVRVKASGINPAGEETSLNFTTNPVTPAAPNVSADDTNNTIIDADGTMEYSADNGTSWTDYDPSDEPSFVGNQTVLVRVKASGINPAGNETSLNFTTNPVTPVTPAAPNVTADDTNNTIIDADGTMEYSADNGTSWTDYDPSDEPSFVGNQTVLVRVKASGINPAGNETSLNFTTNPVTPVTPAAPNVTADDTNNTIIDADGTMEYSADNGTSWSDYDSSNEPSFAGNQTVLVRVKASGINPAGNETSLNFTTNPVTPVTPAAPNVTADDTNNTIIDADGTMEYSADNGTSWSDYDSSNEPSFAGNQTVLVRVKASGINPAGNETSLSFTTNPQAPEIAVQPNDQTVLEGGTATFNVIAIGDVPLSYQWQKDGMDISVATTTSSMFVLSGVTELDEGDYTVVVSNDVGSVTSESARLTVNKAPLPPSITTQPENQTAVQGEAVIFNVVASGNAPLSYQWKKNGSVIQQTTSSALVLLDVDLSDEGNYSVTVSNDVGSEESDTVVLTINILTYQVSFEVNAGSPVNTQVLAKNEKALQPTNPTRSGYSFLGWYKDSSFTQVFDFENTPVTSDITIYAKWQAEDSGSSGGGGGTTQTPVTTPTQTQGGIIVIVNGQQQTAGTETITEVAGKKEIDLVVDSAVITQKIDEAISKQLNATPQEQALNNNIIEVPVSSKGVSKLTTTLTGDIIKKMDDNAFKLSIQSENIQYVIPAKEVGIDQVAQSLGVDKESLQKIKIEVIIDQVNETTLKQITENAQIKNYEILFPPVNFKVVARVQTDSGEDKTVEIAKFTQYVERVMEIPEGVDPSKITTGIVYNADGTFSHVPTQVFEKDGKYYAKLSSLTNSSYSVIWNSITVASVENHWAKTSVNDMASRLVIKNPEIFVPNASITRGDFAEYITKALGIYRTKTAQEGKFKDVKISNELADAITIAANYGIISGYEDGTFRPDDKITREEAMVMYARTMDIVKLLEKDSNKITSYKDKQQVSTWAYESVKKTVSANVFNGRTKDTIAPKGTLTYAEAATAVRNLLVASKLINE